MKEMKNGPMRWGGVKEAQVGSDSDRRLEKRGE